MCIITWCFLFNYSSPIGQLHSNPAEQWFKSVASLTYFLNLNVSYLNKKSRYSNQRWLKYPIKIKNRSSLQKTYRFQKMCQYYAIVSFVVPVHYGLDNKLLIFIFNLI